MWAAPFTLTCGSPVQRLYSIGVPGCEDSVADRVIDDKGKATPNADGKSQEEHQMLQSVIAIRITITII